MIDITNFEPVILKFSEYEHSLEKDQIKVLKERKQNSVLRARVYEYREKVIKKKISALFRKRRQMKTRKTDKNLDILNNSVENDLNLLVTENHDVPRPSVIRTMVYPTTGISTLAVSLLVSLKSASSSVLDISIFRDAFIRTS